MNTVKEFLEVVKKRREREEAVEALRKQTKRNVPQAVLYFAVAGLWLWMVSIEGLTHQIEGKRFLLLGGTVNVICAVMFIIVGIQKIWVGPRDRLLLLLVDEVLTKKMEPNSESCVTRSGHTTPVEQAPKHENQK